MRVASIFVRFLRFAIAWAEWPDGEPYKVWLSAIPSLCWITVAMCALMGAPDRGVAMETAVTLNGRKAGTHTGPRVAGLFFATCCFV